MKTEDDQVGWVYAKYVSVSAAPAPTARATDLSAASGAQCDASLWNHVYHPQRLIVQKQCTEVTGVIVDATNGKQSDGVRHEADGDTHGWLKVDPQFQDLSDEGGNLVFEIVLPVPCDPGRRGGCLPRLHGQGEAARGRFTRSDCRNLRPGRVSRTVDGDSSSDEHNGDPTVTEWPPL